VAVLPVGSSLVRRDINQVWDEISKAELKAEEDMAIRRQRPLSKEMQQHMKDIMLRIVRKDYNVAIRLIDEAVAEDAHLVELDYLRAEVCFNRGMLDDARNALQTALRKDPLFVPAHYLQGYIFLQEEKWDDAKKAFQKAIYLDAHFPLAYFNLAHVYRNQGRAVDAIREYRNTLSVLDARSANTMVAYGGGFDTSTLISVCKNNIERLKGAEGEYAIQGTGVGAGGI
jgi:tetratricopeptide (TPR) repeat protein